jgi:hypothetical protein
VIVMHVDDTVGPDVDADLDGLLVVFNASPDAVTQALPGLAGAAYALSPVQAAGGDDVVRSTTWDAATGTVTVPARTVAVLVQAADGAAPVDPVDPADPVDPGTPGTPGGGPSGGDGDPAAAGPGPGGGPLAVTGAHLLLGLLAALAAVGGGTWLVRARARAAAAAGREGVADRLP